MFGGCNSLTSLDLSNFDTRNVTDMYDMFGGCYNLTSLNVSGFETGNVTDMHDMFCVCDKLISLDLSNFETGNVTDMNGMFASCGELTSLNLNSFDTRNVTDMNSMFHGCSKLISLDLGNFDTRNVTNMHDMFQCCRRLTNLEVSNFETGNVTNMGYMFSECESLTSLDVSSFDTRNVTNMEAMFCLCSKVTGLDVSNFDTGNVTDMGGMFGYCIELTSLDLSNFDARNVSNVENMFKGSVFKTLYSPRNITQSVTLPTSVSTDVWYCSDGTTVTELPRNLPYSVALGKNYVPEEKGHGIKTEVIELKEGECEVFVYDILTSAPIENAQVTIDDNSFITESSGIASFKASDEEVKKKISVTASEYNSVTTYQWIKNKKSINIGLQADNGTLQIISAMGSVGEEQYDFLREKLVMGYAKTLDNFDNITEECLILTVKANKDSVNYELIATKQDLTESTDAIVNPDDILLTSSTGEFSIDIAMETVKIGKVSLSQTMLTNMLLPQTKLYVRVNDEEGGSAVKKLFISTTNNYLTQEKTEQKSSFSFGDKIKITAPDDIPFVGGSEISFGFDEDFPFELEIDEDGIIKIAYNKPKDISMKDFERKYKGWESSYKNITNHTIRAMELIGNKSFSAGMVKISGKICGYGEGNIKEIANGNSTIKVGVIAEIEGKAGYKHYWVIGFVPVKIFVEGSAKGDLTVEVETTFEDWIPKSFDLSGGSFNIKIELEAGAGVGLTEYVYELEVSMAGSINYVNKPLREYQKLWLEASGKVQQTALYFFKMPLWQSDSYKYTLYQKGVDKEKSLSHSSLSDNNATMTNDTVQIIDRGYLNYTNGYNELGQVKKLKNVSEDTQSKCTVVKSAVLPTTTPTLVEVGVAKYLFWVDDVLSRDNYNRTALFYAKSSDGINWSLPERLIPETSDNTIDGVYDIFVSNSKIYIVWQDGTRQLMTTDSITDALKTMSVRYAVLDTTNDVVTDSGRLTDNAGAYIYPCTVAINNQVYFAYVNNLLDTGDIDGNNTQKLYIVMPDGTTKEVIIPDRAQIANMETGIFEGKPILVCELDTDGDAYTNDDREIYICDLEEGKFLCITDNSVIDSKPVIAESGNIYWFQDGRIVKMSSLEKGPTLILDEQQFFYQTVFTVVTDTAGKDTILWETADTSAQDGSISIFQISEGDDGNWSDVVRFAKTTGTIASRISAAGSGSSLQVAHTEGIFLSDGVELKDLCVTAREMNVDIAVEYIDFDEEQAAAGNEITLRMGLINSGNVVVDSLDVLIDDKSVTTLTGLMLKPNESRELEIVNFSVPTELKKSTRFTLKVIAPNEKRIDNNTAYFMLGCPNVYVEADHRIENEHTWLDINIFNKTSYEASGNVLVHKGYEDGEVSFRKAYKKLNAENGYAYSVDLGDYEESYTKYYVEVTSDTEENSLGDNMEFVYIGYGTGIEQAEEIKETYEITEIDLNMHSLLFGIGNTAQLLCTDNKGNSLDVGTLLWVSSDKRIASVDQAGFVTAHREGVVQITAYYGDLSSFCTVTVSGTAEAYSLTVSFDTQGGGQIEPITGIMPGSTISLPTDVKKDGYVFKGWYTQPDGGEMVDDIITVTESITLYAHWIKGELPEQPPTEPDTEPDEDENMGDGLWVSGVSQSGYPYTGESVKPAIKVYDKTTLLTEKTDYTISYKNNIKAGKATITVTGKGNYSGKETVTFDILPADIDSEEVYAMDFYVKIGKKAQKPVPELYYMGTKLKNNKDFTILYSNTSNVYTQTGEHSVTITGKGNYTGTRTLTLIAVEKIVKPKPVSIAKATLVGFDKTFTYTGKACEQECKLMVKTSEGEKILDEGVDYTIQYVNNVKAGTATVIYYGRNGYTGKIKKTYKILPYDIQNDIKAKIKYENNFEYVFAKGGSKPEPVVTFEGKVMKEGVDYTLSYKNNKAVLGNQTPCVTVNGKGCFKGKIQIKFSIKPQELSKMTLVSGDKVYRKKADIYKITPKLMDLDGKMLSAGKDFDRKSITYVYENDVTLENGITKNAGSEVEKTDIIPAGTEIRITLNCGSGSNYIGAFTGTYRITEADIKSAKVTIPKQIYTGNEIILDKSQITIKLSGITLNAEDYDIVRYDNNVKKGKASVTLKGNGNYGGTKTVKFTISTKGFLWWWRK